MWDNMFPQVTFKFLTIKVKIQNKPKNAKEETLLVMGLNFTFLPVMGVEILLRVIRTGGALL
jgi:hypothetical protein